MQIKSKGAGELGQIVKNRPNCANLFSFDRALLWVKFRNVTPSGYQPQGVGKEKLILV